MGPAESKDGSAASVVMLKSAEPVVDSAEVKENGAKPSDGFVAAIVESTGMETARP